MDADYDNDGPNDGEGPGPTIVPTGSENHRAPEPRKRQLLPISGVQEPCDLFSDSLHSKAVRTPRESDSIAVQTVFKSPSLDCPRPGLDRFQAPNLGGVMGQNHCENKFLMPSSAISHCPQPQQPQNRPSPLRIMWGHALHAASRIARTSAGTFLDIKIVFKKSGPFSIQDLLG